MEEVELSTQVSVSSIAMAMTGSGKHIAALLNEMADYITEEHLWWQLAYRLALSSDGRRFVKQLAAALEQEGAP